MDYTGRIITKNQVVPTASSAPGIWTLDEAMQYTKQGKWPPGYQISRSVRLRSSASAYFNRTPASAGNRRTWTWSGWVKLGSLSTTLNLMYAYSADSDSGLCQLSYQSNQLRIQGYSASFLMVSTPVYRDPSAWYHIVYKVDTTQATAADRVRVYVNGVEITAWATNTPPPQNTDTAVNNNVAHNIGRNTRNSNDYLDGYFAEVNLIDGQALTPASFGYTDTVTGVWQPAPYNGTYGTNGFYLNFSDNSAATATTIGKDYSGNGNNWTPNNISVTAGTTYDSMVDVPINYGNDTGVGGSVRGNYPVWNPLARFTGSNTAPITNGNLQTASGGNPTHSVANTLVPASGKFYFEVTCTSLDVVRTYIGFMTTQSNVFASGNLASYDCNYTVLYSANGGYLYANTTSVVSTTYGASYATGDVIGVAYDNGKIWFAKNGSWQASGDPAAGTNAAVTGWNVYGDLYPYAGYNSTFTINFGQTAFSYTAPTGFKALCSQNMSVPTILNGANYNAATLYTGNGGTLAVSNGANNTSGTTFQPDMVWIKSRSANTDHKLTDSVRGATIAVISNSTAAETTDSTGLTAFGSSGFTVGANTTYNNSGATYVGWGWKANGSAISNTVGSITSTVNANTTVGFSILTYTGNGTVGATVGHGLGATPGMVIVKSRSATADWPVKILPYMAGGARLQLDTTDAITTESAGSGSLWNATNPNSTVITLGNQAMTNTNGTTYVAYCFAPITGYSAFGSYTGNGSTDGPFAYLGFRPRWLLIKRSDSTGSWYIWDTSRSPYNQMTLALYPNLADAEPGGDDIDFLSNGFKMRDTFSYLNASGGTYIYAAFAENPFTISRAR